MVTDRGWIERLAVELASPVPLPPEDAPDGVWVQWMRLIDVDSLVGGWLSHAASGAPFDRAAAKEAYREIVGHPEWRNLLPDRFDLLLAALEALTSS